MLQQQFHPRAEGTPPPPPPGTPHALGAGPPATRSEGLTLPKSLPKYLIVRKKLARLRPRKSQLCSLLRAHGLLPPKLGSSGMAQHR